MTSIPIPIPIPISDLSPIINEHIKEKINKEDKKKDKKKEPKEKEPKEKEPKEKEPKEKEPKEKEPKEKEPKEKEPKEKEPKEKEPKEKKNKKKNLVDNNSTDNLKLPTNQPTSSSSYIKKKKNAKIIESIIPEINIPISVKHTNIILHLKCNIREIDEYIQKSNWKYQHISYDPSIPTDIIAYENNAIQSTFGDYAGAYNDGLVSESTDSYHPDLPLATRIREEENTGLLCYKCKNNTTDNSKENTKSTGSYKNEKEVLDSTEIQKIKELKIMFYKNEIQEKKADCFWCSYPYDNDACYILSYGYNQDIYGHGSFCSPECAVAFLFGKQMHWDDSAKSESYQLINYYYGKPNGFEQSIKPALSPYYFLDKYYGNMTIQEYRKMTKSQHHMLIVEKPVTRILPEIHEDNDYLTIGSSSFTNTGKYKVKKQSEKPTTESRNNILREKFGLSSISKDL